MDRNIQVKNLKNSRISGDLTMKHIPEVLESDNGPQYSKEVETKLKKLRDKQNFYSNRGAKEPELLQQGDKIRYQVGTRDWHAQQGDKIRYQVGTRDWHDATVTEETKNPRSFIIETNDNNSYRRNTTQLHNTKAEIQEDPTVIPNNETIVPRDESNPSVPVSP
ncbi:hypothetical protein QE152_g17027 [Popillia japonica]|uniref:Uncharacterized protein n=1 Tax=Popillia japonica TaxID=7064 RepID=A0AAW1L2Q0_POPJA